MPDEPIPPTHPDHPEVPAAPEPTPEPASGSLDPLSAHEARTAARIAKLRAGKATPAERKARLKAASAKGQAVIKEKKARREMIRQKARDGIPLTPEEKRLIDWSPNRSRKQNEDKLIADVARLVIKPQTVEELRLVVEATAAKHSYNPIEGLIQLLNSDDVPDKEKVGIHKALLPFLVPQLPTPKASEIGMGGKGSGVQVLITHFQFPDRDARPEKPLHEDRPARVQITQAPTEP